MREDSPTHLARVVDNCLPLCTDDWVALAVKLIPESLLERGERVEVGHEIGIIALHDDGQGDDEGEENGLWPKAERLADGHGTLRPHGERGSTLVPMACRNLETHDCELLEIRNVVKCEESVQ